MHIGIIFTAILALFSEREAMMRMIRIHLQNTSQGMVCFNWGECCSDIHLYSITIQHQGGATSLKGVRKNGN